MNLSHAWICLILKKLYKLCFSKKQKTEDLDIQKGESVDQEVICQENKENYTDAAETDSGREPVDNKTSSEKKDDDLSENEVGFVHTSRHVYIYSILIKPHTVSVV